MKNAVTFNTIKGNNYLYSPSRNQIILCHPLVPYFFSLECEVNDKIVLKKNKPPDTSVELAGYGIFPRKEVNEQWKKYLFLKKAGFFHPPRKMNFDGLLSPLQVEENLHQIKQVIFETTEDCNLSCTYCIYGKFYINTERGKRKFNFGQAKKILNLLLAIRKKNATNELIISFYGGEPLKNISFIKQIVNFLESTHGKLFSFKYTMSSNGILLARHADFLAQHSFDVSISLDGDETGNSFRLLKNNKSSYNLVIQNLDTIRTNYPDWFEKKISFLTVLHNRNSFASLHRFFSRRYQKKPLISSINTLNVNEEYKEEFTATFLKKNQEENQDQDAIKALFLDHPIVKDLVDVVEKYSGFVFRNTQGMISGKTKKTEKKRFIPTATCMPFSLRVFLSADGSILPCEHISRIFEIGRMNQKEIVIDPVAIADLYNQYFQKIKPLCEKCYLSDHCKECIFNTGIETANPQCDFFTDRNRFTEYLSRSMSLVEQDYPFYLRIYNEAFDAR